MELEDQKKLKLFYKIEVFFNFFYKIIKKNKFFIYFMSIIVLRFQRQS